MLSNTESGTISFDLPKNQSNVIKVIGVGGGGSNAINHMFKQGIKGVDFIVCNTDSQALQNSPVPNKIQLGVNLTEGLGAGANPEVGQQSAIESIADIEKMLDSNTKMVFITAGMGGGTGTGAAPVIAQLAKERDILTVGIVTIPFQFEGKVRHEQALLGVDRLRKQVDSLVVINNNKLREVYGNLGFKAGFSKADEVLATASRGIAEVITNHNTKNIDLKDAKTVLSNSGTAIMGSATAIGENRAKEAIIAALDSPLLNDNKITGAKNVLLLIVSGTNEITIDEIGEINDHIQSEAGFNANIIMGVGEDETLGEAVAVTIIATGFDVEQQNGITNTEPKKVIHTLESDQKLVQELSKVATSATIDFSNTTANNISTNKSEISDNRVVFELIEDENKKVQETTIEEPLFSNDLIPTSEFIKNIDVTFEIVAPPVVENEFYFTTPTQNESVTVQADLSQIETQQSTFSFDNSNEIVFDLTPEIKEIKVNQPTQFVPQSVNNDTGVIKYSLEDFMEVEEQLLNSKPVKEIVAQDQVTDEINLVVKEVSTTNSFATTAEEISPLEMTIEETLRLRADERRRKLKEFNHKFHNSTSRIDEFEKEPAYKRSGVDLTNPQTNNTTSRLSFGIDSNDDIQLRSNNSFLHDNVD